ncbi:MAG TPA: AraC family transcriptional regulator [Actinomycetaceae bacterium]|nr:AraC family transcriptional regulator [Actinomycetaceae bacterium]
MDTLSEMLVNLRPAGALVDRSMLNALWAVCLEAGSSITVAAMLEGRAWLLRDGIEPVPLGPRDFAVVTGREGVLLADDPSGRAAPLCTVTPLGVEEIGTGRLLESSWRHSPSPSTARARVPGAEGAGPVLLTGIFPTSGRIAGRLLEALPPVLHVPHEAQSSHALELVEEELGSCHAGREAMLDWLLDILLIAVLRDGLALPDVHAPAWFGASRDPAVGPALAAMHADPGREWTVGTLAATALVSRATFARRFAELMGEPPISYLAGWRLCLGADLLQERDDTLESIARQVGYSSAYAFSAAFTREYGIRPSRYRERVRGVGAAS